MTTKLITIAFSHYCEKARWALDRAGVEYTEEVHLPMFHYAATYRNGGKRTVPLLVDGKTVVRDSTDIIAWADAQRPTTLLPASEPDRADALALEDDLDRHFGPATRRWMYFQLLDRRDLDHVILTGVPRWEILALRGSRPLAIGYLKRMLKVDAEGAAHSLDKIDETFANVGALLGDGRRYLIGDRFTVADLTFASLAAPILLPPQYGAPLPPLDAFTGETRARIETWRRSPPGQFAQRIYDEHR